jgi:hypothetical protein
MLIPPGANLANQVCAGTGAPPGSDTINGADYLAMAFGELGVKLPSESAPSPIPNASWRTYDIRLLTCSSTGYYFSNSGRNAG